MRITIMVDSAETPQIRELALALHHVGLTGELKVGLNGPDCWRAETPPMKPWQWARVACELVEFSGTPVAEVLDQIRQEDRP